MTVTHHDLSQEFPQYQEKIHALKIADAHFSKLFDEYQAVDKEVFRIEQNIETPSDAYTEELKKKRLALKDSLFSMLQNV